MKTALSIAAMLCGLACAAEAGDVRVGDSLAVVKSILGEPRAALTAGTYQALLFDRGRVELRDGRVVLADLVSQEEADRRRVEALRIEQQNREIAEHYRRQRIAQGSALLERTRSDPSFAGTAAADQLRFWQEFRRKYPELDSSAEYLAALTRREAEMEEMRRVAVESQRIRDLEQRVAEAEYRARAAEQLARQNVYYYRPAAVYSPVVYGVTPYYRARPVCVRPVSAHPGTHRGSSLTISVGDHSTHVRGTHRSHGAHVAPPASCLPQGRWVSSAFY
jgi:hypothetical protein